MVSLFRFLLVSLVFTLGMTSFALASTCQKEIEEKVEEFRSRDEFDRNVSIDLIDVNKDGRNEILYSETCSGNGCWPEIYFSWFTNVCNSQGLWLSRWNYVHGGWKDIKFSSVSETVHMSAENIAWDDELRTEVFISNVTYEFDGERVVYVSVSNIFNRLAGIDLFGDDLTLMGIKGISLTECEANCYYDSSCKAYSYIKSKEWCFPKVGTGQQKENPDVISGVLIDISK